MKNILNFLIQLLKLKKMPRTDFVWLGIKNPETIAQHAFRVAIMNWILGEKVKPRLNLEKVIKISLARSFCKVYTGDITPYGKFLPRESQKRKEFLKKWVRLSKKIKEKRAKEKFRKEERSLKKLIKNLQPELKEEIMNCWLEYEKLSASEGRFVRQGDKIETLLQGIEYWGPNPTSPVFGWWAEVEDLVDNPVLLEFLGKIEKRFYKKKKINDELSFLLNIGKLKTYPRKGWVLRKIKNPETIAEHSFFLAILAWILSQKLNLNSEKILKMAFIHEICEVYAGDQTPYEGILPEDIGERRRVLKRWPRFSLQEKERRFLKDYRTEKKALEKLIVGLPLQLQKEIINLWDDYKRRLTLEGNFVNQAHWISTFFQAVQYWKENKKFPIFGWWEQILEFIDEPVCLDFLEELEKKFFKKY